MIDFTRRVELGIDGNCGYALLGENIQEGEAEFVEIPISKTDKDSAFMRPLGSQAAELWACKEAFRRLCARLDAPPSLNYFFGPSHPYGG